MQASCAAAVRTALTALLAIHGACASANDGGAAHAEPLPAPLRMRSEPVVAMLASDGIRIEHVERVNETVRRLALVLPDGRRLRAKWKPMGLRGSEVQEGYDGNNAPRCEVAAFRLDRLLFARAERSLVPATILRAFHRDVPCDGACARVPRIRARVAATFPELNDHLVLGTLTVWLERVEQVDRFHGGLWQPDRFRRDPSYARAFADLCVLLFVEAHGDANYARNFLARVPALDRIWSIDNGRAFDGVPYYTDEADPDWAPFAHLSARTLVAPAVARDTVERLAALDSEVLSRALRMTGAVDMESGRAVTEPMIEPALASYRRVSLAVSPGLERHGRGVFVARPRGGAWVLLAIGDRGIDDTLGRARAVVGRVRSSELPQL